MDDSCSDSLYDEIIAFEEEQKRQKKEDWRNRLMRAKLAKRRPCPTPPPGPPPSRSPPRLLPKPKPKTQARPRVVKEELPSASDDELLNMLDREPDDEHATEACAREDDKEDVVDVRDEDGGGEYEDAYPEDDYPQRKMPRRKADTHEEAEPRTWRKRGEGADREVWRKEDMRGEGADREVRRKEVRGADREVWRKEGMRGEGADREVWYKKYMRGEGADREVWRTKRTEAGEARRAMRYDTEACEADTEASEARRMMRDDTETGGADRAECGLSEGHHVQGFGWPRRGTKRRGGAKEQERRQQLAASSEVASSLAALFSGGHTTVTTKDLSLLRRAFGGASLDDMLCKALNTGRSSARSSGSRHE